MEEPVIAPDPPRRVRGYVGVLLRDGRSGWLRSDGLVPWRQASYPRLSCMPIRLPDGMLDVTYAHPG
ncbi:hypothetical protein HCU64_11660 [Methylobacterium sp. C25]|uniref:hypothetical protein n=1 Tax=Methylobacterium sp. C25 TaxID=2721622 RepID=UPI001F47073A|nr:hypothetical protein [Methylobacterium sp. C25]MCE4224409.1 hypothetical protein [Methylobacterium sp. C25]